MIPIVSSTPLTLLVMGVPNAAGEIIANVEASLVSAVGSYPLMEIAQAERRTKCSSGEDDPIVPPN
ncbi:MULTISPECIES: hypothetical protein [unclassified Microcoleus]|uniref:hypothetical protein n=1 Tax=unclassified Microcoleus TaxID=2642155 RepID=UPI002FD25EC4